MSPDPKKMKIPSLKKIIHAVMTPLININMAGLVIGAIWVGITLQWPVIGIGVIIACFSSYLIPLLLIPIGIFSHFLMVYKEKKQKNKEQLMFILIISYILLFITMWCINILEFIMARVALDAQEAGMLWANSVAMLPLLMWINQDRENFLLMTLIEAAQIAFLLIFAIKLSGIEISFWTSSAIFGGFLSFVAILLTTNKKHS